MESNTQLRDEVTELSYKLEALSEEVEAAGTDAAEKSVPEPDSEALVDNSEQLNKLHRCLQDHQAQLASQTERFVQLEQQQQIRQDAQLQQVAETLKAIKDIDGRVELIEERSVQGPQGTAEGALKEALVDVQQALHAVQGFVGSTQTLSNSTVEMQSKCMQDIADLSSQMEQIQGRLEQPGVATTEEPSVEALKVQMQELATDIESYQKRSENVQNSSNVKQKELADAAAALRELVAEHAETLAAMEADVESRGAATSAEASEQRAHVENSLKVMEGQLSALSEVIGNTKAESAELRQIVNAERNMSSQTKDDMLTDKLALEERLEVVEERLGAMDLVHLQRLRAVPAEDHTAQQTSDSPVLEKEHTGSDASLPKWTDDLQQLQEQLGAHIHDLSETMHARVEDAIQQAATLSGQVEDTSVTCKALQEGMKLLQNAFLEMQTQEHVPETLSQPAAEELSLRVSALHKQFEDMKTSYKSLMVEQDTDTQEKTGVAADYAAAEEATSAALESFKAAVSDRLSNTVGVTQLQEMKAELESEIQSIRSCMLQGQPHDLEVCTQYILLSYQISRITRTLSSMLDATSPR